MKRKAIFVIALMMIMPGANAAGIRSAAGMSQSAWNASPEYQAFQCPEGTSRGEGVDMNFTTNRSDDYYFVECNLIVVYTPIPTPVINANTTPTETATVVTRTDTPTVVNNTGTTSSTTTNSSLITDFNWNSFMNLFETWFGNWFATWFNSFFVKWLGL